MEARRVALRLEPGHDTGFAERHPELLSGRGTIRLRAEDAGRIADDELRDLARAVLSP